MKRKTTKEFIEEAITIHGNYYDYSKVQYKNAHTHVTIICPIHGEFIQKPNNHLFGNGCLKCGFIKTGKSRSITQETVIKQFKKVHGNKYDYSLVNYVGDNKNITIICPEHGKFQQTPSNHKNGRGCSKCGGRYIPTNDEMIEEFKKVHGNKYDYSLVKYVNHHTKVKIVCYKHGEFEQTPNSHKRGAGCPVCNESKGEKEIRNFLISKNINYISQYKFIDCKNQKPLIFDFYLPDLNICIEFNGIQHYKVIDFFGGEKALIKQQKKDIIKKEYCQKNNIPLIIIKYDTNILNKLNIIQTLCS